ncbi:MULTISPECIES: ABC transporter ATP-binding protein [Clostridium]|uniref:ATP-binding cassette domain-containing protein n=1 Tax=Clostridium nitritogenes TaxID=83340 RepID=A0ABN1LG02_9CLOT|nr:ATP-binding cassette domain-containing protein [Clostridium baratii]MBT9830621.1 ATP-binding cassette domain-containing protein [Clostridium baratii]
MSILKLDNISYKLDNTDILKNINLEIFKGDCISLIGPSGSGKSTLLKLCSSLISPTSGKIFFNSKDFYDYDLIMLRREISYCVQMPILFGNTVLDNLKFPFEIRKKDFDKNRVISLLDEFNLSKDYLYKEVANLSGGEKQRISLIRNLIFTPKILLLDEATSALDPKNSELVENIIKNLNLKGVTVLWVTHNIKQSNSIFNKRLTVSLGEIIKEEAL